MASKHLTITGLVQGVWFRASTKEKANELGITGWVKNCEDGSVEIHAEGSNGALKQFEEWCWEGPEAAVVKNVIVKEAQREGLDQFQVES